MVLPRLLLLLASLGLATTVGASPPEREPACARLGDGVVVDAGARRLYLCRDGRADAVHAVNLGQGGLGKKKQGDKKTPLGRYRLGRPRASRSGFTWFVPVGYPTAAQRRSGYTGGAIGIHGPPDWLPASVVDRAFATPWTDGCIMVRTREQIEAIRAWLLEHEPRTIVIVSHS